MTSESGDEKEPQRSPGLPSHEEPAMSGGKSRRSIWRKRLTKVLTTFVCIAVVFLLLLLLLPPSSLLLLMLSLLLWLPTIIVMLVTVMLFFSAGLFFPTFHSKCMI